MFKLLVALLQLASASEAEHSSGRAYFDALRAEAETACNAGNASLCVELGEAKLHFPAQSDAGFSEARRFFKQACDLDEMRGCGQLGRLVKSGRGGPKDLDAGLRLQERACRGGYIEACTLLGMHYQDDGSTQAKLEVARTYFWQACDLVTSPDDVMPCTFLTTEYTARPGLPPDPVLARRAQDKLCAIDPANWCTAP